MENKLLTMYDKMGNFGGCYKTNDKLKSLITQAKQNIERKGIDTVTIHDYNNYIMQSNNPWPVRVEASDCRYVVIACSKHRIADYEYFNALATTLTAENANLLLTWLAHRDLTRWNPRQIPDTELRHELKMQALDLPVQFIIYLLSGQELRVEFAEDKKLSTDGLYRLFVDWARNNEVCECNFTERTFALALGKIVKSKPLRIDGKVVKGYDMNRDMFTEAFCKRLHISAADLQEYM
jgi:hypothetical protein